MSRIGKLPISIPAGVTVNYDETSHVCTVKGPKGELSQWIDPSIKFNNADGQISFEIDENSPVNIKQKQAFHGLYRSLVNNMVVGVSAGYTKVLELVGVGYRVSNQRSEEHTSELQSRGHLVCRLLLEKKKRINDTTKKMFVLSIILKKLK